MSQPFRNRMRRVAPSVVTALAICAGMAALRMTLANNIEAALCFVLLAVVLDAADGRLARHLGAQSAFGAELDSLADFFNFGIVPGIILYTSLYRGSACDSIGWLAVLMLAVCCALRLARFNVSAKETASGQNKNTCFAGVPAPALASLALMPVFVRLSGWHSIDLPLADAVFVMAVSLLAISPFATISVKHVRIGGRRLPFVLSAMAGLVVCLTLYPWPTLIVGNCLYMLSLPFSYLSDHKHTKALRDIHAHSADRG